MRASSPIAVKICGITQTSQALEIASIGADAIGVIGVKSSPRFLTESKRRQLFYELSKNAPNTKRVWVIADLDINEIESGLNGEGTPSTIQLHGYESKQKCAELKKLYPNISCCKSFRVKNAKDLLLAQSYQNIVDSILLDAWSKNSLGGTGNRIPIELIKQINFQCPWWLAGGISPDCIQDILSNLDPYGVDASSKLETIPGVKDIKKVKDLLSKVKLL